MKRFLVVFIAAAVLVSMARTAMAQAKTVASEMRVETGTVEAIEAASRTVSLKKPDGTYVTTVAGPDVKRFAELKIGDKVSVRVLRERRRAGEAARRSGGGYRGQDHDSLRTGPCPVAPEPRSGR